MRRWLTIFLIIWLPFQLGWAAAANCCQHASGSASSHFGHHSNKHIGKAPATAKSDAGKQGEQSKLIPDHDCTFCHLSALQPLPFGVAHPLIETGATLSPTPVRELSSYISDGLERPNWLTAS